ncbi:MCE family protein [Saccharopolyspora mangrovi]|uniref:MCE family protein n=1 Tax=Saccharopolyspora mangrovi TaxID=3082379 RepID=A0ABU6AAW0_9PSEU|nr:MCE family protein [Saccharopolyspora sp. S2-29]MEB3368708.1 MCE family protein [Saccharopolyspora sp. S2-29]
MLPGSMTRLVRSVFNRKSAVKAGALAVVGLLALSGCSSRGVYDMPLPGGADVGNDPYDVKVRFSDVLDLVPNAGVRVNDVAVGRVSNINLAPGTWEAEVTVTLNGDVKLPANAIARLRQSSLLGEKYVELAAPPQLPASGRLTEGATIPLNRSNRNPEVEEVLGALSLLLNGGGVAQLQSITQELNKVMNGRESDIRGLLNNLDELVSGLDAQRNDIVRALDSINRLSAKLNEQRGSIDTALRDLGPGLQVLNEQRGQLVTMLQSLDKLSGVATNVVDKSHEDLVHDLNQLAPTLHQLAAAGETLPKSLETLVTFPFPDNAVDGIGNSDYNNLYVTVDLNLSTIVDNLGRSRQPLVPPPGGLPLPLPGQTQQPQQPAPPQPKPEEQSGGGVLGWLFGGGN